MSTELMPDDGYDKLVTRISDVYTTGRVRAEQAVNVHMTETYWQIGHDIVEYEQGGKARAEYGKALLKSLAGDLTLRHGRGFNRSNLVYMRLLYLEYPTSQTPSDYSSPERNPTRRIGATVSHQSPGDVCEGFAPIGCRPLRVEIKTLHEGQP